MLRSFADGRLFGTTTGGSPPSVLALHGWRRTHRDFDEVLAPAGDEALDAVALDLPGSGATPPPPAPWGSPEYADLVAAVLDEMATPVVVVAHSFGGRVAVHLAAAEPERVGALVLTAVPLLPRADRRRPSARYRAVRALRRAGLLSEARLEAARNRHGSPDYRAAEGVMRDVFVRLVTERYDAPLDALAARRLPVTLVWGDDDAEVPLSVGRAAAERLGGAELVVCPGAGHLTPRTAPGPLRRAVTDRLAAVRR
ncbi:MAG: alpha/beta fold hydrolase [Acidimicrobiales bacterium]